MSPGRAIGRVLPYQRHNVSCGHATFVGDPADPVVLPIMGTSAQAPAGHQGTSAQGTGWPGELVAALVSPASGSLAGIFAPFEQPEHALKLLPGPRGRQFPAALRGVVHDVTPRLGGLSEPSLPFQQEGA